MKKLTSSLLALAMFSFLSGCVDSVEVKDGHVPAELMSSAKYWIGTYSGRFDGLTTDLTVSFDGDRPVITTSRDLAGNACNSKIGLLKKIGRVATNNNGDVVAELTFEFDPGHCSTSIEGRTLTLIGKTNEGHVKSVQVSYVKDTQTVPRCEWVGGGVVGDPTHPIGFPPSYQCWQEIRVDRAFGKLNRVASAE